MSWPSVLSHFVSLSSRPPLHSSVPVPSNRTTAFAGAFIRSVGLLRSVFFSSKPLPSAGVALHLEVERQRRVLGVGPDPLFRRGQTTRANQQHDEEARDASGGEPGRTAETHGVLPGV